jgi:hypothetical protein
MIKHSPIIKQLRCMLPTILATYPPQSRGVLRRPNSRLRRSARLHLAPHYPLSACRAGLFEPLASYKKLAESEL